MNIHYNNNQTTRFILPIVTCLPNAVLLNKEFIGAYLGDMEKPEWDSKLLLAYHYPWAADWQKFEKKIINLDNYISSYDYYLQDENIVVYVLDIPDAIEETINAIMNSNYFLINPNDKLKISKFWINYIDPMIITSLFKEKHNHQGQNLYTVFNFEDELFDIHKY